MKSFIEFDYKLPPNQKDFPHDQIYGRIATLFTVSDAAKYSIALQKIAGKRLRSVVIGNHTIGTTLLDTKATQGFESFIPLNKIQYRIIDQPTV